MQNILDAFWYGIIDMVLASQFYAGLFLFVMLIGWISLLMFFIAIITELKNG